MTKATPRQLKTKAKQTQNSAKNGLSQPVFFENIFSKIKII